MNVIRRLVCVLVSSALVGCSTTSVPNINRMSVQQFEKSKGGYSNHEICVMARDIPTGTSLLASVLFGEYRARDLNADKCTELTSIYPNESRSSSGGSSTGAAVATAVVAIGLAALLVKAAKSRTGGSGPTVQAPTGRPGGIGLGAASASTAVVDYEWEWDQFYGSVGSLVWACRGVQTGQFALEEKCIGKLKLDWKWPGHVFQQ